MFEISVNGKVLHSLENKSPARYKNVDVYAGNPWHPELGAWYKGPAGWIRDLEIYSMAESNGKRPHKMWPGRPSILMFLS